MKEPGQVIEEYIQLLESQNIEYYNRQGLYILIPLKNTDHTFTQLIPPVTGKSYYCLSDYAGNFYTGVRIARRAAKTMQMKYPEFKIWEDKYTSFEIDIEQRFRFTSVKNIHKRVLRMAEVIDDCIQIGKDIAGDAFCR